MNMKEKALTGALSPAIGIITAMMPELKNVKPENPISQFIADNVKILIGGDNDEMGLFLCKVFIVQANNDPRATLTKLLMFYESFRIFYENYLANEVLNET